MHRPPTHSPPPLPAIALAVIALLSLVPLPAAQAEELVIGFEDLDFYPYGKPSEDKIFVGYLRSVLEAFAADRGHRLAFAVTPLKRLYMGFAEGDVDMFVPDNPAWSQEYKAGVDIYYSDPIAVALDGFAVLPGREREAVGDGIVHVGTILGFTVEPLFDDAQRKRLVFDRVSRFESSFRALLLGRVDAVYCNLAVAENVLAKIGKPPASISWSRALPAFKSDFQVSSTRRELIDELNRWLRSETARVEAMKREYGVLAGETRPWGE